MENKQKRRRCRDVKPDGSRSSRRLCIVNCVVFVLVITCFSSRRDALILSNKSAVGLFPELTFFDEVSCVVNPPHQTLDSGRDSSFCTLFKVYVGICQVISVIEFFENFSATRGFLLLSCVISNITF